MADTKISALSAASALAGTEVTPVVQGGATVKATIDQIKTWTSDSPVLVTPEIGAATGTSLTLSSNCIAAAYYGPAGTETGLLAMQPAQITTTVAGAQVDLVASDAIAGTSVAGAAAGGDVLIQAGNAARLTSGNADGGDINLVTGAGIGTGVAGQIMIPSGTAARPAIAVTGDNNTGIYHAGGDVLNFSAGGVNRAQVTTAGLTIIGTLSGNASGSIFSGFKSSITALATTPINVDGTGVLGYTYIANTGATALIEATLPSAIAGNKYTFVVTDADGLKLIAFTGDDIRVIDKITATAGYIQSTTIGSTVTLVAIDATTWVATAIHGVWTDGTFTYDDTGLITP